jgi:hypothetical protein
MFQHYFNIHSLCDPKWCKYHNNKALSESEGSQKYRKVDSKEYKAMKEVHEKYTSDEMIKMLHHSFSSQKNEALNKAISHVAPKHTTFAMTSSLKTRVSFVVCVDSLSYAGTINEIYDKLDLVMNYTVEEAWKKQDVSKLYTRNYQNNVNYKRKRSHKQKVAMVLARSAESKRYCRDLNYRSGIGVEDIICDIITK